MSPLLHYSLAVGTVSLKSLAALFPLLPSLYSLTRHNSLNAVTCVLCKLDPRNPYQIQSYISPKFSHRLIYLFFYVQGSMLHEYMSIIVQPDAAVYSLFVSVNCSTCFGWYLYPSSGAHITVSAASGFSVTVTATCRERCCRYSDVSC
jgi:hypothetical protein